MFGRSAFGSVAFAGAVTAINTPANRVSDPLVIRWGSDVIGCYGGNQESFRERKKRVAWGKPQAADIRTTEDHSDRIFSILTRNRYSAYPLIMG